MYTLSQLERGIQRGLDSPNLFLREANRLYYRHRSGHNYNTAGVDIFDEDWDTLLVLDACRYDMFEEEHSLDGQLETRCSRGSHTREFLRGNFAGRDLRDTVYVTASPQLYRWQDEIDTALHAVVNVWREDGWNDEHETVLPETVNKFAYDALEQYPDKRLVVHYLQPHYPFIDSGLDADKARLRSGNQDEADIWGKLMTGTLSLPPETVWGAYRRNLRQVLPHVEELLEEVPGRTVVTSDHGNMVGERSQPIPVREWGHPPGVYTDELVKVPWLVSENGARRTVVAEAADTHSDEIDDRTVRDRLEQLGYAE